MFIHKCLKYAFLRYSAEPVSLFLPSWTPACTNIPISFIEYQWKLRLLFEVPLTYNKESMNLIAFAAFINACWFSFTAELTIPSNANVYYAISTQHDLNFVLREKQEELNGSALPESNLESSLLTGTPQSGIRKASRDASKARRKLMGIHLWKQPYVAQISTGIFQSGFSRELNHAVQKQPKLPIHRRKIRTQQIKRTIYIFTSHFVYLLHFQ